MRTAKEIHQSVGVPLTADYLDKMRPEYRAFQVGDIENIQKEAIEEVMSALKDLNDPCRTTRALDVEQKLRDILSART